MLEIEFTGGQVLGADGLEDRPLALAEGRIVDGATRKIDARGFTILPGIVDLHGDGFERHVAPRRGAMKDIGAGLRAAEAEIAANGITTAYIAQFVSWEGGLRGPEFAGQVFDAMRHCNTITDLRPQLRFETHLLELCEGLPEQVRDWGIDYVVLNDHLPHKRLSEGRKPKQMVGQALKAGRNPETHFEMLLELEARGSDVPNAMARLCTALIAQGVRLGSHDDNTDAMRANWQAKGVKIAEFPESLQAAEGEGAVILGAPNVVRGGSHKGNMSALEAVLMGYCDALASDYHYPSPRRAALFLAQTIGIAAAWKLVSAGPAAIMGLHDRGTLRPGLRADVVILDAENRVAGTICGGVVSYLTGDLAARFVG